MKLSTLPPLSLPPSPSLFLSLGLIASCDRAINTLYTSSSAQRNKDTSLPLPLPLPLSLSLSVAVPLPLPPMFWAVEPETGGAKSVSLSSSLPRRTFTKIFSNFWRNFFFKCVSDFGLHLNEPTQSFNRVLKIFKGCAESWRKSRKTISKNSKNVENYFAVRPVSNFGGFDDVCQN